MSSPAATSAKRRTPSSPPESGGAATKRPTLPSGVSVTTQPSDVFVSKKQCQACSEWTNSSPPCPDMPKIVRHHSRSSFECPSRHDALHHKRWVNWIVGASLDIKHVNRRVGTQPCDCVAKEFQNRREAVISAGDLLDMADLHVVRAGKSALRGGVCAVLSPAMVLRCLPTVVHWLCL
jgi:hypothetical protein